MAQQAPEIKIKPFLLVYHWQPDTPIECYYYDVLVKLLEKDVKLIRANTFLRIYYYQRWQGYEVEEEGLALHVHVHARNEYGHPYEYSRLIESVEPYNGKLDTDPIVTTNFSYRGYYGLVTFQLSLYKVPEGFVVKRIKKDSRDRKEYTETFILRRSKALEKLRGFETAYNVVADIFS